MLRDRITNAYLTDQDCLFIAKERFSGKNPLLNSGGIEYAIAIEWAEAALKLTKKSLTRNEIEELIIQIKKMVTY